MPVSETNVWVGGLTLLLLGMAWLELLGRGALGYLAPFVDKVSHSPLAGACCSDCSIWGVRCGFGSPAFAGSLTGVHPVFAPLTACPALAFVGGWTPLRTPRPPQHLRSDPLLVLEVKGKYLGPERQASPSLGQTFETGWMAVSMVLCHRTCCHTHSLQESQHHPHGFCLRWYASCAY